MIVLYFSCHREVAKIIFHSGDVSEFEEWKVVSR
jgi:hypothetical protein